MLHQDLCLGVAFLVFLLLGLGLLGGLGQNINSLGDVVAFRISQLVLSDSVSVFPEGAWVDRTYISKYYAALFVDLGLPVVVDAES